jgi:sialate O-acetylesterase
MVLQRAPYPASVWGYAEPGATVTVTIAKQGPEQQRAAFLGRASAVTSAAGTWRTSLPAQPASTEPVNIIAHDGSRSITLTDVLFGDVYVCSGQSNSE